MDDQNPSNGYVDKAIAAWDRAEIAIKKLAHARLEAYMPSINELRYAGRSLISAWKEHNAGNIDEVNRLCAQTYHAAMCAEHDAFDGTVLFIKEWILNLEKKIGADAIESLSPDVKKLKELLASIETKITSTRGDHSKRPTTYSDEMSGEIDRLIEIFANVRSATTTMYNDYLVLKDKNEALIRENDRLQNKLDRGDMMAAFSIIIAVISFAFGIFFEII